MITQAKQISCHICQVIDTFSVGTPVCKNCMHFQRQLLVGKQTRQKKLASQFVTFKKTIANKWCNHYKNMPLRGNTKILVTLSLWLTFVKIPVDLKSFIKPFQKWHRSEVVRKAKLDLHSHLNQNNAKQLE